MDNIRIENNCINVWSDFNTWIDFIIRFDSEEERENALSIVEKSYNDWWEINTCEPIADWIGRNLIDAGIYFEMYFKSESEDDE